MARLYANENFPLPSVEWLRRAGHDVITSVDAQHAGLAMSDEDVLAWATTQRAAVLTHNRRDFVKLHGLSPHHQGIIVCSVDADFALLAQRVHAAIESQALLAGKLVRVNRPNPG